MISNLNTSEGKKEYFSQYVRKLSLGYTCRAIAKGLTNLSLLTHWVLQTKHLLSTGVTGQDLRRFPKLIHPTQNRFLSFLTSYPRKRIFWKCQ